MERENLESQLLKPNKDAVLRKAPQSAFPKAARFVESFKYKRNHIRDDESVLTDISRELIYPDLKQKVLGGAFPKDKRFIESFSDASITSDLSYNPNFDLKYRKAPAAVIKRDENKEALRKKRKEKYRMLLPELITSEKLNLSVLTADTSAAVPGPGAYTVAYSGIEVTRNIGLSKASRFELHKKDNCLPLDVKYTQVEVNTKGVRIRPPTAIDEKLLKKRQYETEAEEKRARAELEALKEREKLERERVLKEARVERPKTEKERLMELFRLVSFFNLA